ncbi:MAG TPA: class I SAM-dependent rRNA methyltransferase [Polyangiaceae bacterium]|nr:class I SAM-dependent rRNA methyltransferase [Polyangiaceae bacterium]
MGLLDLRLSRAAAEPVRRGHPWVFREKLERAPTLRDGDEVRLVVDGATVGRGLATAEGPIAVRVWTHDDQPVSRALFVERVKAAVQLRARWFDDVHTTAYRVLHGEGDRMPGVVVDRYASVAVLVVDDASARAHLDALVEAIWGELEPRGVRTLLLRTRERGGPKVIERLRGEDAPSRVSVREHDVPFVVDIEHGQKTGAFLDQRENRRRVGELASGQRVLNLFSYAGGFSLHAARGGAVRVTSVDVAAPAHASAQESFKLAGHDPSAHEFVTQDAFAFLEQAARRGARWDVVISDPPSFAPNKKAVPNALAAYRKLHRLCVSVLAPGGLFCAGSCSSHVDAAMFAATLDDAAVGSGSLRMLALHGPPIDHPTLPAWPEGRYLKFAILG